MNTAKQVIDEVSQDEINLALSGHIIPKSNEEIIKDIEKEIVRLYKPKIANMLGTLDLLAASENSPASFRKADRAFDRSQETIMQWAYNIWKMKFNDGIDDDRKWTVDAKVSRIRYDLYLWIKDILNSSKEDWLASIRQ